MKKNEHMTELLNPVFYYKRDAHRVPRITYCLLVEPMTKEVRARGIAFCSLKDNPCKQTGKQIALGRAWQAIAHEADSREILRDAVIEILQACGYKHVSLSQINDHNPPKRYKTLKSMYRPGFLTPEERDILSKKFDRKEKQDVNAESV
jgi:hypothetical protein